MSSEYTRWQKTCVMEILRARRVVVISGARQCGKTTLAKQILAPVDTFTTLDDTAFLDVANTDPMGFVKHTQGTMVIDEIQKAPSLLLSIKIAVDNDNRPGQFLLTGSANILTLPTVTDSLAGRISHIRLRGLTVGEILGNQPMFLARSFRKDWPYQIKGFDKEAVLQLAFRGGYPEVLRLDPEARNIWHKDYINSMLTRDLRDILNIRRKDAMHDLMQVLASWSSKLMDIAGICGKLNINRQTLSTYINVLESLFLFEKVDPWIRTDYEKAGRKAKFFATDTGVMASVLDWNAKNVFFDADRSGKLIETFVFTELAAQIDLMVGYNLYHYRDRNNREIDFLVENDQGELLGIEVKAGSHVSKDDCRHMVWFKENITRDKPFIGVVLYTGEHTLPLGKDMYAVPIAALWEK